MFIKATLILTRLVFDFRNLLLKVLLIRKITYFDLKLTVLKQISLNVLLRPLNLWPNWIPKLR